MANQNQAPDRAPNHAPKFFFFMLGGTIGLALLIIGGFQLLEFTDSTAFCGRLCHDVMYPEYTAYQSSTHSRVLCASCHVGPGASYLVKSKISGIPLIVSTITGDYERPITVPVKNLRPARETCEQCHRPERFAGDIVRVHATFQSDEANTQKVDTRVLRVGGGEAARDIHWHITAQVWYVSDEKRQDISWVGVEQPNGNLLEYTDLQKPSEMSPERINEEKRLMDCIDCHNRATHVFRSPNDLIDTALTDGRIDKSLPFIKREGLKALDPPNSSLEEANSKIEAIKEFYQQSYPQVYRDKRVSIDSAITELKEVARLTTFASMNVSWKTYPSNAGHQETAGCFRCHGKLTSSSGTLPGKIIRNDCELCHYFDLNKAFSQ